MTDKVQKIREGVERLKSQLLRGACSSQIAMETRCKEGAYDEVISLFDSLQEEPVSEELEEASIIHSKIVRNTSVIDKDFIAGAKWQKRKDKEEWIKKALDFFGSNYNSLTDGGVLGVFDNKKKMIEEFVEFMKDDSL